MADHDTQKDNYMTQYHDKVQGLSRLLRATGNSWSGLKTAYIHEAAFRQEILLAIVLIPAVLFMPLSFFYKVYFTSCVVIVLVCELLNTAIEVIVDALSPEYNLWAKQAKDLGSAAVMISLINVAIAFIAALVTAFK